MIWGLGKNKLTWALKSMDSISQPLLPLQIPSRGRAGTQHTFFLMLLMENEILHRNTHSKDWSHAQLYSLGLVNAYMVGTQ